MQIFFPMDFYLMNAEEASDIFLCLTQALTYKEQ